MPFVSGGVAAVEALTLDPTSEDATNSPVELSGGSIHLVEHSYPAPPLEIQYAGSVDTEGMIPGARKDGNRTISFTLECEDHNSLAELQGKVAKIGREGGTLKRVLSSGQTVIFDLLARDAYEPTFDQLYHFGGITGVQVTFPAKPFGRGEPVALTVQSESSLPALVFTESGIAGDVPALGELEIANTEATQPMATMWWGMESRYLDSSMPLLQEAETPNVPLIDHVNGTAAAVGSATASGAGSNVARQTDLATSFASPAVPYAGSAVIMRGVREGHGTFRLFARIWSPAANTGTVQIRVEWGPEGQGVLKANDPVTIPAAWEDEWFIVDLGEIAGSDNWFWQISAISTVGTDDLDVDCLIWLPVADGWGRIIDADQIGDSLGVVIQPSVVITHESVQQLTNEDVNPNQVLGPPKRYEGDFLRVPPAGAEGREARFVVFFAHDAASDGGAGTNNLIGNLQARLTYTPRWLVVPE